MILPFRKLIWVSCFYLFSLGDTPTAFAVDILDSNDAKQGRRRSLSVPLYQPSRLEQKKRSRSLPALLRRSILPDSKDSTTTTSVTSPLKQYPLRHPLPTVGDLSAWNARSERGPWPAFMNPDTYRRQTLSSSSEDQPNLTSPTSTTSLPPEQQNNKFTLKNAALFLGGAALAASPLGWASYAAAVSFNLCILGVGVTELIAGVAITKGLQSTPQPAGKPHTE